MDKGKYMLKNINEKTFDDYIKDGVKFVAFTAPWCGYCQKQKPILEELSKQNIEIAEINPDENPIVTSKYGIHAFPSFLLFKEGRKIAQFSGYRPKYNLLNTIIDYLRA